MKPINREELLRRLDSLEPVPDEPPIEAKLTASLKKIVARAEWFDFGPLDGTTCLRAAHDARPFRKLGLLKPPYDMCVLRARLTPMENETADILLVVIGVTAGNVEALMRGAQRPLAIGADAIVHVLIAGDRDSFTQYLDTVHIRGVLPEMPEEEGYHKLTTGLIYDALWLVLNTKGITKTVDVPDEKLNRARRKAGKPVLQRVTRIDAAQYMRALNETERMERGGHHASPRMHLRRAHLRYYRDERYSAELRSRPVVIDATIVNIDKDVGVSLRSKYVVDREEAVP